MAGRAGSTLPDLDKPFDELGWVKRKLEREGLTYEGNAGPSLPLRPFDIERVVQEWRRAAPQRSP